MRQQRLGKWSEMVSYEDGIGFREACGVQWDRGGGHTGTGGLSSRAVGDWGWTGIDRNDRGRVDH